MAENYKFINIDFPFQESKEGFFLNLNNVDAKAIRADLMHLLLTRKGERLYMPDFGTDLLKYIFEMNDDLTRSNIRTELNETIKKYLPNLSINSIEVTESESNEHNVIVRLDYTITEDAFQETDFILLQI